MKKIYLIVFFIFLNTAQGYCLTFGTYKPESEYGLFDSFKFQVFDRDKNEKIIQLKSDMPEEKEQPKKEQEIKNKRTEEKQDDYQMYKFMLDDTIPL